MNHVVWCWCCKQKNVFENATSTALWIQSLTEIAHLFSLPTSRGVVANHCYLLWDWDHPCPNGHLSSGDCCRIWILHKNEHKIPYTISNPPFNTMQYNCNTFHTLYYFTRCTIVALVVEKHIRMVKGKPHKLYFTKILYYLGRQEGCHFQWNIWVAALFQFMFSLRSEVVRKTWNRSIISFVLDQVLYCGFCASLFVGYISAGVYSVQKHPMRREQSKNHSSQKIFETFLIVSIFLLQE